MPPAQELRVLLLLVLAACEDPTECSVPQPAERVVPGPCTMEVSEYDPHGACKVPVRWVYAYEGERLVRAEKHNTVGISLQQTITYEYDAQERLAAREVRSAGEVTNRYLERSTYRYDDADHLIAIDTDDQYDGELELRSYDLSGHLIGLTRDRLHDGTIDEAHHYVRDNAGVLVSRECDGCGRLLEDADGTIDLVCKREHVGDTLIESCDGGHWPLDGTIDSVERVHDDVHGNVLTRSFDGETWVFAERRADGVFETANHYDYSCWQ
jgi:YD repeat-containing protein